MRCYRGIVLLAFAACASDRPPETYFEEGGDHVSVQVLGDGFVRSGDRRIPLEAMVLELRQATRLMSAEQLSRFAVYLRVAPTVPGSVAQENARAGVDRLINELVIMEVPLVKCL